MRRLQRVVNTITNNETINEDLDLDLSLLEQYNFLSSVEKSIKDRKEQIKKKFKNYFAENNTNETPVYKHFIGMLDERDHYYLDAELMEYHLPPHVFNDIAVKEINLENAKKHFLLGNIPLELISEAERITTNYSFAVRKVNPNYKKNKQLPFWKIREQA